MNYLQLVNDFLIETGMEDEVATVTGQIDDGAKAVIWIRDAWTEIQRGEDWKFRWAEGSFNTVADQRVYTPAESTIGTGDKLDKSSLYIPAEDVRLGERTYSSLKYADDASGKPFLFAQKPNGELVLYYTPDAVYSIDYEKWSAPVELTADTDVPSAPVQYHKAIVWKAIVNYAREQGGEWLGLYRSANKEFNTIYSDMLIECLPDYQGKVGL